ncbi:hypothetical protein NKI19_16815 [Mesorhizobium sp. M0751]|uniref:hypothetical protein n=1 Tax=unclassified Mesorhizobium TaxID=325217 RepID=UPI003335EC28
MFVAAAVAEIAGCFSFWLWLSEAKPSWWLAHGLVSLVASPGCARWWTAARPGGPTRLMAASVSPPRWQVCGTIEGVRPDRWDTLGAAISLVGAAIIIFGPRSA